ncbi:type III secretion system chaperone family protein [Photobacterium leiognathi]|uniref:hypothetical protein n=1 Tax=Photobacterium leiognathi TaxID=553611 RepID=UPI0029827EE1|nr:hypothetical protein [Photobacterium leiognathi]
MKKLRDIMFRTLVNELGISANMLSRIEGNKPIEIELKNNEKIFISLEGDSIQTIIDIPLDNPHVLTHKSKKLIEFLMIDEDIIMNIKKDKLIIGSEWYFDYINIEKQLADKLKLFNKIGNYIRL